ncbi:hypothetical protein F4779DRAFT_129392 [Xylariaceae sp. FL0662B]|nr:hypothetical protein F4779DRAFT_129392 [Xylariaceae sp. FL0662B]
MNNMLERDTKTGLVFLAGVNPNKNPHYDDPKLGTIRKNYLKQMEEEKEEKEEEMQQIVEGLTDSRPQNFKIEFDEQLVVQEESSLGDSGHNGCQNAIDRPRMWVSIIGDEVDKGDPEWPFLNRVAYLCMKARIRYCRNEECKRNRENMDKLMPQCEWPRFREWALLLVSCQASFSPEGKLSRAHTHLAAAANIFHWLLIEYKHRGNELTETLDGKDDQKSTVDLFGICEVIYWMVIIQGSLGLNTVVEGRWGPDFLPPNVTAPAVTKAVQQARELGLCPNRFWNLALVSERKYVDLPVLMEAALEHPQLRHEKHDRCTSGFCRFTTLDSTKVRQLHKCEDPDTCKKAPLKFDPELLNESLKPGETGQKQGRTVWSIFQPFEVSQDMPYVAISHVWSDGTGIGLQDAGVVNRCLFNYLADIIREDLHCDAIWWDTISIPTDKVARRKAINEMHHNYSRAACTLLHDQYLLDFEWADDGSPCLALVFSPWLTRGWTALELIMSKEVKVLYKGHDGQPVIKDLDADILADDPRKCTRAHWIASTILRRLRKPIRNVTDLMAVLKPRSTSWPRDRMVIAGLLAGLDDFDYSRDQDDITKAIIDKLFKINPSSLHHGQVTVAESGGWSWCPPSLYDMPADSLGDLFEAGTIGDNTCLVDKDGVLSGAWYFRPLEKEDITMGRLVPNSSHMSVTLKVKDALRRWRYCLMLRDNWQDRGLALLVCPVGKDGRFIRCRYVGSVHELAPPRPGGYDKRYGFQIFKIGDQDHRPDVHARKFVKK